MKLLFYVTDFGVNGCQDLLVVDNEGNVIDCASEAIYGLHTRPEKSELVFGDAIITDPELKHSLMDAPNPELTFVYKVPLNVVLRHISVDNEANAKAFIEKYQKVK